VLPNSDFLSVSDADSWKNTGTSLKNIKQAQQMPGKKSQTMDSSNRQIEGHSVKILGKKPKN